jgi:hypothetical protein
MGGGRGGIMISPEGEGKIALQLAPLMRTQRRHRPAIYIFWEIIVWQFKVSLCLFLSLRARTPSAVIERFVTPRTKAISEDKLERCQSLLSNNTVRIAVVAIPRNHYLYASGCAWRRSRV